MKTKHILKGLQFGFYGVGVVAGVLAVGTSDAIQYQTTMYAFATTSLAFLGMSYLMMRISNSFEKVYRDACRFKQQRDYLLGEHR